MAFGKGKNNVQSVENAPKIKKEKIRNANKANKNLGILVFLMIAVLALGGVYFMNTMKDSTEIEIVTLTTSVPQDGLITEEMFRKSYLSSVDYNRFGTYGDESKNEQVRTTIVRWEERGKVNNKYATYYIKAGTPLYWDAVGNESPKQYSYLYNMDGELLKVNLSPTTFGKMLVPGDHINVRAVYKEKDNSIPTPEEYELQRLMGMQTVGKEVERHVMLFNNVSILDMLNSNGESIFDLYYEVLALPKEQQIEVVNSDDFINSVKPASMLLNVTPEEADRYMEMQSKSATYMMTMLPRTTSNAITELLNELQTGFARKDK